jgi:hypothetical protein
MAKQISQARFNAFTIGTRDWKVFTLIEEVAWFANVDETVIGAICFDLHDQDYHWIVLARDEELQFRWVDGAANFETVDEAKLALSKKIDSIKPEDISSGFGNQGDKSRSAFDLIEPIPNTPAEKMHEYFKHLFEAPSLSPARQMLTEISRWLVSKDPNFKRDFQFHQFDQRLWEIYIWAVVKEAGYNVTQHEAPDFKCEGFGATFSIEATTMAPSEKGVLSGVPQPQNAEELAAYQEGYLPIKFASALTAKLNKKHKEKFYWELPECKDDPFLIAVADFHAPGSMTYSQGALFPYLYGSRAEAIIEDGVRRTIYTKIEEVQFRDKKIPAGFFRLPNSENVSGVMFSNAGTLTKFNRMGILAGFHHNFHSMRRIGRKYNLDQGSLDGTAFDVDVLDVNYRETWGEELVIYHNPHAKYPLEPNIFPDALHVFEIDGRIYTGNSDGKIIFSTTASVLKAK